jgi:hypothetical protein
MFHRWLNKIFRNSGFKEDFNKFSTAHNILGDKINVPVPIVTQLFWWFFSLLEEFPQVGKIDGCTFTSVEWVSINMEYFFSCNKLLKLPS